MTARSNPGTMLSLTLPIILSAIALFIASFLSWMVVQLHRKDWRKLPDEDAFLKAMRDLQIPRGNYMFPGCEKSSEMKSEDYQQKMETGPCGVISVFGKPSMGRNLVLTFLFFLAVSFCIGYLATMAVEPGAGFEPVFRFVSTASFLIFIAAIVQHAIWFRCRIAGHVVESIAYAVITGAIFAALWPGA